jgi:hypothetical protein
MSSQGELGNLGEPPISLTTWPDWGTGGPKALAWSGGFHPGDEPFGDTTNARQQARYRGGERQAKHPERDRVAVVAAHSTGEGGEVRPKRPTGGKATAGQSLHWQETGERR